MNHSEQCLRTLREYAEGHNAWVVLWPNFCRDCEGTGWAGAQWSIDEFGQADGDPCECTMKGFCPRCGEAGLTSERYGDDSTGDDPCKLCGWDYDDFLPPASPEGPCECQMAEWELVP